MRFNTLVVLVFITLSCSTQHLKINTHSLLEELYLVNTDNQWKINFAEKKKILIHYFDGNCSSCIAGMVEMDKLFKNYQNGENSILFISSSSDTVLLNYYIDKSNVSSIVMFDKNKAFYESNKKVLDKYGSTFLIDKNGMILTTGNPIANRLILKNYIECLEK